MSGKLPPSKYAYVYAIKRADGAIKIGHSGNVPLRMYQLKWLGFGETELQYWIRRERPIAHGTELLCHWMLRDRCVRGEWFRVTREEATAAINEAAVRYDAGERPPKRTDRPEKRVSINVTLPPETMRRLTEWRAAQWPLPNQSAAMRHLIEAGLEEAERAAIASAGRG